MVSLAVPTDAEIIEKLCDRFRLAADACAVTKREFAARVGMSPSSFANLGQHRNPPSHTSIYKAWEQFGIPADYFYYGIKVGFRDPAVARRLSDLETRVPVEA